MISPCYNRYPAKKKQIWKNAWLHLFFYNWKRVIHRMGGWNWNCESTQYLSKYLSNTLYIRNSWLQVLFWKIPCPLRNGWPQLLSWQRNTVPWKKLFPATKRSNRRGKSYFLGTTTLDHSLFLWASVSLRFLYICQ